VCTRPSNGSSISIGMVPLDFGSLAYCPRRLTARARLDGRRGLGGWRSPYGQGATGWEARIRHRKGAEQGSPRRYPVLPVLLPDALPGAIFATLNFQLSPGAARGIRTPDPIITNDVLYRLSYCGLTNKIKSLSQKSPKNRRPSAPCWQIR
jgi:hypothetical protein